MNKTAVLRRSHKQNTGICHVVHLNSMHDSYRSMIRLFLRVMMAAVTNTPTKRVALIDAIISISVDDICMVFEN